jgi:hypothetical protein
MKPTKVITTALFLSASCLTVHAQFTNADSIVNNGSTIGDWSTAWNNSGTYIGNNNGVFEHYGPSTGTFTNTGSYTATAGHADIFKGPNNIAGAQEIAGTTAPNFFNATFQNGNTINLINTAGANVSGALDFSTSTITTTVRSTHQASALRFNDGSSYTGGNGDAQHVNGYVTKTGNDAFTFPVGSGTDARTLAISAPATITDQYSVAWIAGNPGTTGDPSNANAMHAVTAVAGNIRAVNPAGQWDWVPVSGTGAGLTVTVSIPAGITAPAANLRLAGWNGTSWVDLSGAPNATGNTEGSTLSGTMVSGIQAIAVGNVAPDLTPTLDIDNLSFTTGSLPRDFVVNVFEINNIVAPNPITVRIPKLSAFTITYSATSGTSDVFGGTPNENSNWTFTENTSFITATAKTGVTIPANGSAVLGFTVARKAGVINGTTQNLTTTVAGGSAGEVRTNNNTVITSLTTTP